MLLSQNVLYESSKRFVLADFVTSHGQLLLRAQKINDSRGVNTDIVFSSADYIQVPSWLDGISIIQNTSGKRFGYEQVDKLLDGSIHKAFEIQSGGTSFYVVAASFEVFENELAFGQTSLGVFQPMGRDKRIAKSF